MKNMNDQIGEGAATGHDQGNIAHLASSSISRAEAVGILTSPDIMADFFRTRLSMLFPLGSILEECRPKVLRDRLGSRQVVSYRLFFSGKAGRKSESVMLVLKRYADKAEGKKTHSIMRMLWEGGFNHESTLRIPMPVCYLEDMGLQVQERAHGMLLRNDLKLNCPVSLVRMKRVAHWLAKLHHLDADFEGIAPHPDEETSLRVFVNQVGSKENRSFMPRLERLASLILRKLSAFKDVQVTPVHGDFQCENIYVDKEIVTVVDFDRFCRSDPARDVGYIIAQMRVMSLLVAASPGCVSPGLKAFWEEYLDAAFVEDSVDFSARATLFAARKCLQSIYYMSYVLPGEGMEIISVLLKDAERFGNADRVEEVLEIPISSKQ